MGGFPDMRMTSIQLNLVLAWTWILLGFVSGMSLGLFFHRDDWLGGYASFRRRLYRLGHVSFFGLGAVNLFFFLTARGLPHSNAVALASGLFAVGAVLMPVCCLLVAHLPKAKMCFAAPVLTLIGGGVLTISEVIHL
jgi:hypothetical protein